MRRRVASAAKPNPAHFALAKFGDLLQDRLFVCTQNVDNLHELAGTRNVVHMHGELFKSRCDTCSRRPFDDTNLYDPPAEVPRCECGGRIRPHICWFGEVPFELERIYEALDACTVFIAAGTSGVRSLLPASSLKSMVGHGRSTWDRRNQRTYRRSRNAIWEKRGRCCPTCSVPCDRSKGSHCTFSSLP
jgi:NAD-dependent deacetylase